MRDHEGKFRGFIFAAFEKPKEAQKTIQELNGKEFTECKVREKHFCQFKLTL